MTFTNGLWGGLQILLKNILTQATKPQHYASNDKKHFKSSPARRGTGKEGI